MREVTRRGFLGAAALGGVGLAAGLGLSRRGDGRAIMSRVLVIGGGPAGEMAALSVRAAAPGAEVLLIERDPTRLAPRRRAATRFERPEALAGLARLRAAGVAVALDEIVDVDWRAGAAEGFSGRRFAFDRILLAPGVGARMESVAGYDARARHLWPAAWGDRREARRLRAQLAAAPENARVVVRAPDGAISDPTGPYRRAVEIARLLARAKPQARLLVLDAAAASPARRAFAEADLAPGLAARIEWRGGGEGGRVLAIDAARGLLETEAGPVRADVVNFIPAQSAGEIAWRAGLVDGSGWCPCGSDGRSLLRPEAVVAGDAAKRADRTAAAAASAGARAAAAVLEG